MKEEEPQDNSLRIDIMTGRVGTGNFAFGKFDEKTRVVEPMFLGSITQLADGLFLGSFMQLLEINKRTGRYAILIEPDDLDFFLEGWKEDCA